MAAPPPDCSFTIGGKKIEFSKHSVLVISGLLSAQLFFAGYHVMGKYSLGTMSAFAFLAFRFGMGTIPLFILAFHLDAKHDWRKLMPPKEIYLRFSWVLFLSAVGFIAFIFGLMLADAHVASIMQLTVPAFSMMIARFMGLETLSAWKIAGVLCAMAGAGVMVAGEPLHTRFFGGEVAVGDVVDDSASSRSSSEFIVGTLFFLLQCAAYALFVIKQRPLFQYLPPLTLTSWVFLFNTVLCALLSFTMANPMPLSDIPLSAWLSTAYSGVIAGAGSYWLVAWGIRYVQASVAMVFTTSQPPFSAVLSAVVLGEVITGYDYVGMFFVTAGLLLVAYSQYTEAQKRAKAYAELDEETGAVPESGGETVRAEREAEVAPASTNVNVAVPAAPKAVVPKVAAPVETVEESI